MRFAVVLLLLTLAARSAPAPRNALNVYAIDVEGGKSALVVSPSGESLLIDTGNLGERARRDADRILAAAKDAGLERIDHLLTTHWHRDHFGAMAFVAERLPVGEFLDHGPNVQRDSDVEMFLRHTYPVLYAKSARRVVTAGDTIPIGGLDVRVVSSAGKTIQTPLPGAGVLNPYCAGVKRPETSDDNENPQSVGIRLAFGGFRLLDLGDLTVDQEFDLMCPANRLGQVDVFMVSHHAQPSSNSALFVHAIGSRVAITNDGTRKGGQPDVMKILLTAPGLENLWQLHASQLSGQEYTAPGLFIANQWDKPETAMPIAPSGPPAMGGLVPVPAHNGTAYWIKVTAHEDGSFVVANARNGFSKKYGVSARD